MNRVQSIKKFKQSFVLINNLFLRYFVKIIRIQFQIINLIMKESATARDNPKWQIYQCVKEIMNESCTKYKEIHAIICSNKMIYFLRYFGKIIFLIKYHSKLSKKRIRRCSILFIQILGYKSRCCPSWYIFYFNYHLSYSDKNV